MSRAPGSLSWPQIIRLGLVQAALGSIVVMITSILNRVMIVEYALPAMLPGLLVAVQYGVQMIRPRFGHGSDVGGRRTPWIVGGMLVLACGCVLCAVAAVNIARHPVPGIALALAAYAVAGLGVGASGTSLLVLMAKQVHETRRAAAATIMWVLMILGFAVTSTAVGHFLDPFSALRLILVMSIACAAALALSVLAVWNVECDDRRAPERRRPEFSFKDALRQVWSEPQAQGFTLFVFVSMLAYSAQELILEPFAGLIFGYSVGESSKLSGLWHGAAFAGMVSVGIACSVSWRFGSLRQWTIGGCAASAGALLSLVGASLAGPGWPLRACVFALGFANGAFAVAAIGSMMQLSHLGRSGHAGVRMGLWGAAQAVAFALGGLFGSVVVDSTRYWFGSPRAAYVIVFGVEGLLFVAAALFASRIDSLKAREHRAHATAVTV